MTKCIYSYYNSFLFPVMIRDNCHSSPFSWEFCGKCIGLLWGFYNVIGDFWNPHKQLFIVIIFVTSPKTKNQIKYSKMTWSEKPPARKHFWKNFPRKHRKVVYQGIFCVHNHASNNIEDRNMKANASGKYFKFLTDWYYSNNTEIWKLPC